MLSTTQSTQFDTLTPIQIQVLQSLVEGLSVTAAAKEGGLHRTLPDFARAYLTLRQHRADWLVGDLADLAIITFPHILSDESASASVRLKAAVEIVKLAEAQSPTTLATALADPKFEKLDTDLRIAAPFGDLINPPKTAPAPKQRSLPLRKSPQVQALLRQPRHPKPRRLKNKISRNEPGDLVPNK